MKIKKQLLTLSCFIFLYSTYAAGAEGTEIKSIGCYLDNSTCFVYVTGTYGPAHCKSNSIRWSKDTTTSGKEALSLLMSAFESGKKVYFNIADTCLGEYPTFDYIIVNK